MPTSLNQSWRDAAHITDTSVRRMSGTARTSGETGHYVPSRRAVTYRALRPHIRSGDLIAFESRSFAGRVIRTWTGSRFAHVAIAMWLIAEGAWPRLFVLEARGRRGVTLRLLSSAGECWHIPTGIDWNVEVNRFVWPRLGTANYDWASLFRLITFRTPSRDGAYYCSEFAGEVIEKGGFPVTEADFSDPGTLVHAVLRSGAGQIYCVTPPQSKAFDPK